VWRKERMIEYFIAGAEVAFAMIMAQVAFWLAAARTILAQLSIVNFELVVNGRTVRRCWRSASFALLGRIFGILTTMQLLELANPTQPLLRRLLMEAPGTYHHSIHGREPGRGAPPTVIVPIRLLVRVASTTHDIGKLERTVGVIGEIRPTRSPTCMTRSIRRNRRRSSRRT